MDERTKSLEGWEIIDTVDGKRWLGQVVHVEAIPGTPYERVRFSKCLEFFPLTSTALALPKQDARAMLGGGPQMPVIEVKHYQSGADIFTVPLNVNELPPWTVTRCGGVKVSDLDAMFQENLLKNIQNIEGAIAKRMRDLKRSAG